jgi:NhaP-type Na+/H+ or K+/H+ antiporter
MLLSMALIMLIGMASGYICRRLKLPGLLGMIITGIILGPYVLDLIDPSILNISADLRKIALIIILTRAGLTLDINDLKRVGRPAILMCFVPATFELAGMLLLAPRILGISLLEAAIMGAVVAAVSPAVVVPKMIKLIDEGYGTKKSIPQLILAGASVDDVYVIVLFSTFTGLAKGDRVSAMSFINIPVSVVLGIALGIASGWLLAVYFKKVHVRDTIKVIIVLSISFILVSAENALSTPITFSALIAVMFMGIALSRYRNETAVRLSGKFNRLWVGAEVVLFVLVGASVDIGYALSAGAGAVILIFGVLIFRIAGVFVCLTGTNLNMKERLFCMLAYTPKATVQAAIGSVPLAMGLSCGSIVLTVAVLAILITAPLGAFMIDLTYKKLLSL